MPIRGEFGLWNTCGDYDDHQKVAARVAMHFIHSFEDKQSQPVPRRSKTSQIRLADMSRRISTAQLLGWQLAQLKDRGTLTPVQVSMAKWNNCRMALDIARDCRDMLGGSGISAEYVPIRHALNLESVITYEGTETIHQLTIGRELTGINAF